MANIASAIGLISSPIGGVERDVLGDLALAAVPVREQAFLVVVDGRNS